MSDKKWAFIIFLVAIAAGLIFQSVRECDDCGGGTCAIIEDQPNSVNGVEEITP